MIAIVARSFRKAWYWASVQDPPILIPSPDVIILLTDDPGACEALRGRGPISTVHHVGDFYMGRYSEQILEELNVYRVRTDSSQAPEGGV